MPTSRIPRPDRLAIAGIVRALNAAAFSTERCDHRRAEEAMRGVYRLAGLHPPAFAWVPSPLDAAREAALEPGEALSKQFDTIAVSQLDALMRRKGYELANLLYSSSGEMVTAGDDRRMWWSARIDPSMRIWQLSRIMALLRRALSAEPPPGGKHRIPDLSAFMRGAAASYVPALSEAARDVLEIPEAAQLTPFVSLARHAGFALPKERWCWMCERPSVISTDENGALHASDGPALDWSGALPFYFWHGEEVPAYVMAPASSLRAADVRSERNVLFRDIMIERFGLEPFMRNCGATPMHEDETGVLWVAKSRFVQRRICAVEVVNGTAEPDGSFTHYFLRVPPTTRSARQGVAWTYGLTERQYDLAVRT